MKTLKALTRLSIVSGSLILWSCGAEQEKEKTEDEASTVTASTQTTSASTETSTEVIEMDVPEDSTGADVSVGVAFASDSTQATSLSLVDASSDNAAASTLAIGGGVVLHEARLNIGAIKIKASREQSEKEKALEKDMKEQRKLAKLALKDEEDAMEEAIDELERSYKRLMDEAVDEAAEESLEQERDEKIAAKKEELAALKAAREMEIEQLEYKKDNNLRWKGPYVYDVVKHSISPQLATDKLKDGSYRRIEFQIKPNRSLAGSDKLLNKAFYAEGTALIAGIETAFQVSINLTENFRLQGLGLELREGVEGNVAVVFKPALWFEGVDFSQATIDQSGVIIIDDISNEEIYKQIRKNLKASTKFGRDEDGDGTLSTDEEAGDGLGSVESESESETTEDDESEVEVSE